MKDATPASDDSQWQRGHREEGRGGKAGPSLSADSEARRTQRGAAEGGTE